MKFPITLKLFLLTIIPIIILTLFMSRSIKEEYTDYTQVIDLDEFTSFSNNANSLLQNLHTEQTLAQEYILHEESSRGKEQLTAQFRQTDTALEEFATKFLPRLSGGHENAKIKQALDFLPSLRQGITYRTISQITLSRYYESLVERLLSSFEHYALISKDERIDTFSMLLKELLILKERAFQEKALLHAIFSSAQMTPEQHQQFSRLLVAQEHHSDVAYLPLKQLNISDKLPDLYEAESYVSSFRHTIQTIRERQHLFSRLKEIIGYGGLVHTFKNYLLRGEAAYYERFIADYPHFLEILNAYQSLAISNQDEYTDLLILEDIFEQYRNNLDLIKSMRSQGYSREAIDKAVRIDDMIATDALKRLPRRALAIDPQLWAQAADKRLSTIEEIQALIFIRTQERMEFIQDHAWDMLVRNILVNLLLIALLIGLTYTLAQHIIRSVRTVQDGLGHFFDYISFKRDNPPAIHVNSSDEFALMADEINRQIVSAQTRIEQDEIFILEATEITEKMRDGDFNVSTAFTPLSPSLQKLHTVLSELVLLIQQKIEEQTTELEQLNASLSDQVREQTRALQAKFQELNQFKLAIEQTMLVCSVSKEGIISEANSSFYKQLHYTEDEVVGRHILDFIEHSERKNIEKTVYSVISKGDIYQGIQPLLSKKGDVLHADSAITPIQNASGEISEYICFYHNITPIIEARDNAIAAEKSKDEFLSNMSHEIRTPLNAILGFVGILQKRLQDEKDLNYLEVIANSGTSLLAIINDILDFAKIQSGKFQIAPYPFQPVEQLSQAAMLFASKAYEKEITYLVYIDPNLPSCINADMIRIKQVLSNLLSNAIKFTPTHGTIKVRITSEDETLLILVQDTGIGIDETSQKRIFKAFEQADGSTTREFGGTGLGLSITTKLIELMQGSITLKSQKGSGSTFKISIPYETCDVLRPIEHNYDKIRSLKIALAKPDEQKHSLMLLIRHYLQDFGITDIMDLTEIRGNEADLVIFVPNEETSREIMASDQPAIALLEQPENPFKTEHHIYPLHAPFVPTAIMEALDDATIERLRGFEEVIEEEIPQFEGEVLVVEDNVTNRMLITLMLEEYGLRFEVAHDGVDGVAKAKEKRYDLILMDENMPNLNGLEAMKQIKTFEQEESLTHTPVIALTANVMQGDRERFIDAGMDGFVGKPINNKELEEVLKEFLKVL